MPRIFAPIGLLLSLSPLIFGQPAPGQSAPGQQGPGEPSATLPAFDLADVHPNHQLQTMLTSTRGAVVRASGRYEFVNATMLDLVRTAYNVEADKVLGGPSWLESDRFDIFAKAPPKTSPDTAKLMLQTLLADRFKLVVHKDMHSMPTYALSVGKAGHKLKEADGSGEPGCKSTIQQNNPLQAAALQNALQNGGSVTLSVATLMYSCHGMTMAAFTDQMRTFLIAQNYIGTNPTADQTGLKGAWDFDFKYTPKPPANTNQTVTTANGTVQIVQSGEYITLFDAMEKQLGLKLEAATLPIPVYIVDSVNRKPTDNSPEVTAQLPPPPAGEFDVAELRLTAPGGPPTVTQRNLPNGQVEMRNFPLRTLLIRAWGLTAQNEIVGAPKWLETARVDLIAKMAPSGLPNGAIDQDALNSAVRALLTERFKVAMHTEMRPGTGWVLAASKPKLAVADPANRTLCKEGPGKDGKDPRIANPILSRLVTCQNMTMAQFAEELPITANGYFKIGDQLLDATGLTEAYDFTLSFSAAGLVAGGNRAVLADGAILIGGPAAAGGANPSDPNGSLSLPDALAKQLGLKLEQQKRPVPTIILDHIEEKPID